MSNDLENNLKMRKRYHNLAAIGAALMGGNMAGSGFASEKETVSHKENTQLNIEAFSRPNGLPMNKRSRRRRRGKRKENG